MAKLNWLVGTWTATGAPRATFAQGKNELTGTTTGPDVSSASSLIYDQGRWVWNALIATRTVTSPVQLLGEDVDVTATYLGLKGEVSLPGRPAGHAGRPPQDRPRIPIRKRATCASAMGIGSRFPVRTCKRK